MNRLMESKELEEIRKQNFEGFYDEKIIKVMNQKHQEILQDIEKNILSHFTKKMEHWMEINDKGMVTGHYGSDFPSGFGFNFQQLIMEIMKEFKKNE